MTAQDLEGVKPAARRVTETEAWSATGVRILVAGLVMALIGAALLVLGLTLGSGAGPVTLIVVGILLLLIVDPTLRGLVSVQSGQARVVQLFGQYHGTVRSPGLQWVNPFAKRRQVSTRIRNLETPQAKVNDADGNPIEIAAVVVWQVADTALAIYAVDDFERFVAIQAETAVRHIASSYAYDTRGSGELSLRDNADEITGQLTAENSAQIGRAHV